MLKSISPFSQERTMRRTALVCVAALLGSGIGWGQTPLPPASSSPPSGGVPPRTSPLPGAYPAGRQLPPTITSPFSVVQPLAPKALDNTQTFDHHLLELRWTDNRWQLYAGGM